MLWNDGILPPDRYIYAMTTEKITERQVDGKPSEWNFLEEADERFQKLMQWVYNYHVLFSDDCWVICYEQRVFQVNTTTWGQHPWEVALDVFDYWASTNTTVVFRLAE